jgi:hypothetical protein
MHCGVDGAVAHAGEPHRLAIHFHADAYALHMGFAAGHRKFKQVVLHIAQGGLRDL